MPTALIVGASRGLGYALVEEHLKRGWEVIATERHPSDLSRLKQPKLMIETLETTDEDGVDALKAKLEARPLDMVFVNAAIAGPSTAPIGKAPPAEFTQMMLVNVLAPLRLLDLFADLVVADGIVAAMSSSLGSIELNGSGGWEAYRTSKAALNMGLRSLAARRSDRRTYLAVDPGWVRTDMGGANATLSIEESIPSLVDMLQKRRGAGGVAFVNYRDENLAW